MIRTSLKEIQKALNQVEKMSSQVSAYTSLLQQCGSAKDLDHGKLVHAHILENGYGRNAFLGDQLIQMYGKCGSLDDAHAVFDKLPRKNVFSCNFMISAYIRHGHQLRALNLFQKMEPQGVQPDAHTYSRILGACCSPGALAEGRAIHQRILRDPSQLNAVVQNAIVNMYAKCGSIEEARNVFDGMPEKNVVSWNSMISAYAQNGHMQQALDLYDAMDVQPNETTMACILGACSGAGDLAKGKLIHERTVASGLSSGVRVQNALVYMYAKCGSLEFAERLFGEMQQKDVVSWNTMISSYTQNGHSRHALNLFRVMDQEGILQDSATIASILAACENQRDGIAFHARIIGSGYQSHVNVQNGLVAMYAKCGGLDKARSIFDGIQHKNLGSWTAMVAAYAQQGHGREALNLYQEMKRQGVEPDFLTFPSILSACTSLEEGKEVHAHIIATRSESNAVQNALLTMYANRACIEEAKKVFDGMKSRDFISWTAMISAYAQLGYPNEALETFEEMDRGGLRPAPITFAVILGACSDLGSLLEGKKIHERILEKGFESARIVQNALMNMYGKCGSVEGAKMVFDTMSCRDVISWTAMIAAYAQHGHPTEALALYTKMCLEGIQPSSITFTCILMACSHAGLMEEGQQHFTSIAADHGQRPTSEHYGCIIDLLGRAGWLKEAEEFIHVNKSLHADDVIWRALLSACKMHCDDKRGGRAAGHVAELDPGDTSPYVLLSNIQAELGDVRKKRMSGNTAFAAS